MQKLLNLKYIKCGVLFLGMALWSITAQAELKIAVVDPNVVIQSSLAFQDVQKQMDSKSESYKQKAKASEEKLTKKYQNLESQKTVLAKEEYEKQSWELAKEAEELNKAAYLSNMELNKAFTGAVAQIEEKASEIVKTKVQQDGYHIILSKLSTVYADDSLDITQSILKEVNKSLPKVKVKFEK